MATRQLRGSKRHHLNIWTKRVTQRGKIRREILDFRPVQFEFNTAAEQCRIDIFASDFHNRHEHITNCTVAEAVKWHVKPGRCLVPLQSTKEIEVQFHESIRDQTEWTGSGEYKPRVSKYVLLDLPPVDRSRPQYWRGGNHPLFHLEPLQDYGITRNILGSAYAALASGRTATFSSFTQWRFGHEDQRIVLPESQKQLQNELRDTEVDLISDPSLNTPSDTYALPEDLSEDSKHSELTDTARLSDHSSLEQTASTSESQDTIDPNADTVDTRLKDKVFFPNHWAPMYNNETVDLSRVLYNVPLSEACEPLEETYRVLCWHIRNMPYLWPQIVLAAMPEGSSIAMRPNTDGGQIQFVIKPTVEQAVKFLLSGSLTKVAARRLRG